ncbi:MAG: hypothetical protein ACOVQN_08975 [Exiguobacterium sp.]
MGKLSKYSERVMWRDPITDRIKLTNKQLTDSKFKELLDCLLLYPNFVNDIFLKYNKLTDESGIKLARLLTGTTSFIKCLDLMCNRLKSPTVLAIAAALRVNASVRILHLSGGNTYMEKTAFVDALRLNPVRPAKSEWILGHSNSFNQLMHAAENSIPPSMLEFALCVHLDIEEIKTRIH